VGDAERDDAGASIDDSSGGVAAPQGSERRDAPRRDFVTISWWSLIPDAARGEDQAQSGLAQVCDISGTGIGLVMARVIPIGALMYTRFVSKDCSVAAVGRVVYCGEIGPTSWRCGIHFEVISPLDRVALRKLVEP
jgi:hypothetical protein